jgi:GntR family transcriptional regulator
MIGASGWYNPTSSLMTTLNRSSFTPIYYQLSENIRAMIENGLLPGDQLPSENELTTKYNVSRNTVRLAIDMLIKQGLVYRQKGKGTFVAPERMHYGLLQLASFSEEMRRRGLRTGSHVLNFAQTVPPAKIAAHLQLRADQQTFLIERLRLANDEPLALHKSYVPCVLCPTLAEEDLTTGSLYQLLEGKYGLRIERAAQTLKPTIANEYEAKLLQVEIGSPLLLVEGTVCLDHGAPVEYAKLVYRGDRYEFSIHATRQHHASRGANAVPAEA